MKNKCNLCNNIGEVFYKKEDITFFKCLNCFGIYIGKKDRLNKSEEFERYRLHKNNIDDLRYQKFVYPITSEIFKDFTTKSTGLDFGAGSGPVIEKVLKDKDYNIKPYDPFFHKNKSLLKQKYNYIACCEVMEHFYNPNSEFKLLSKLLHPKGKLYCMTSIYNDNIDFSNWHYKNDPTHVFLYQHKTIEWIKENYIFSEVKINENLIIFSK